jgi:Ankyrin repeats (3 copies)
VDALNDVPHTPLLAILAHDYMALRKALCMLLLEFGANVHIWDAKGNTPLHYVAKWGHCDVVWLLLDQGADVDLQDNDHKTALHLALSHEYPMLAQLLLKSGANVNIQDHHGRMPLHYMVKWRNVRWPNRDTSRHLKASNTLKYVYLHVEINKNCLILADLKLTSHPGLTGHQAGSRGK